MHAAAPGLRAPWLLAALLGALVAVGCERQPTAIPEAGGVARLDVTPREVRLGPRDSVEFTAVAYTEGGQIAEVKVTWQATEGVMAGARASGGLHRGWFKNGKCGENTVTATAHPGNQSGTAVATVDCATDDGVSASQSTVSAAPATITTSSGSSVSTVTVTARDASGNPVSGATVVLLVTGSGNTLTQPSGPTNASGVATGTLSSTASGAKTVSATIDGVAVDQTATVTVHPGPPSASQSTVSADPTSITAGNGSSTVTVTVKDTFGNPVGGSTVLLAATGTGNTLTQPSGPTNANGVVTGTLSSTVAESKTVSASASDVAIDQTVTVQVRDESPPPPPPASGLVLVGAGDIAGSGSGDEATAQLLDAIVAANSSATVFTAGDNAYPDGGPSDFANYYDPTWGRHKARTRPSPGNHDYNTSGASGYYTYFGSLAGPSGEGYYSYDLGDWHIISLNSNIDMRAGSAQEQWLRADLAASSKQCVLAYWHHPRFSSSSDHGSSTSPQPLYQALYDYHAEVIVSGHDHTYERFSPQDAIGTADPNGIRQFVVGTGGRSLYGFGNPEPNSEVRYNSTYGVIKFTLSSGDYAWEYIPVSGSFSDTGTGSCH